MATAITNIQVKSAVGTLFLTGPNGEQDDPTLWVKQEGSQPSNGGPVEGQQYVITYTGGTGSPATKTFKGRFAGVGYEFND